MNWRQISWISGFLFAGAAILAAYAYRSASNDPAPRAEHLPFVEIPRRDFSPEEYRSIQETFWSRIQGQDRHCAEAFVFGYMGKLRRRCEIEGGAKGIGGGCAHMTSAMNYPEVLEAGLEHCGIQHLGPNDSSKPKPVGDSARIHPGAGR